jgi:hypothetical protein
MRQLIATATIPAMNTSGGTTPTRTVGSARSTRRRRRATGEEKYTAQLESLASKSSMKMAKTIGWRRISTRL